MYSTTSTGRASKGSVQAIVSNDQKNDYSDFSLLRLGYRIRFNFYKSFENSRSYQYYFPFVRFLFLTIKPKTVNPESLVFPAKRGGEINSRHFIQNAWKGGHRRKGQKIYDGIVTQLVKEGKVARYRTQYNTRHTFITMCLEAGVSVKKNLWN